MKNRQLVARRSLVYLVIVVFISILPCKIRADEPDKFTPIDLHRTMIGFPKASDEKYSGRISSTFLSNQNETNYSYSDVIGFWGRPGFTAQLGMTFAQNIPSQRDKNHFLHSFNGELGLYRLLNKNSAIGVGGGFRMPTNNPQIIPGLPYASNMYEFNLKTLASTHHKIFNHDLAAHFNFGYYLHLDKYVAVQRPESSIKMSRWNSHFFGSIAAQYIMNRTQFAVELWGRKYDKTLPVDVFDRENYAYLTPSLEISLNDHLSFYLGSDVRMYVERIDNRTAGEYNAPELRLFGGVRVDWFKENGGEPPPDDTLLVQIPEIDILLIRFYVYKNTYNINYNYQQFNYIIQNIFESRSEKVVIENYVQLYQLYLSLKSDRRINYSYRKYMIEVFEQLLVRIYQVRIYNLNYYSEESHRTKLQIKFWGKTIEEKYYKERLELRDAMLYLVGLPTIAKRKYSFSTLDGVSEWGYAILKLEDKKRFIAMGFIPDSEYYSYLRWELYKNKIRIKSGPVVRRKGNLFYVGIDFPAGDEEGIYDLIIKGQQYRFKTMESEIKIQLDINVRLYEHE